MYAINISTEKHKNTCDSVNVKNIDSCSGLHRRELDIQFNIYFYVSLLICFYFLSFGLVFYLSLTCFLN